MAKVFDLFEADSQGVPTGFCAGMCATNPGCPDQGAGARWYGGRDYLNSFVTNDITSVAAGYNGARCDGVGVQWSWGPTVPTECMILVETYEDFNYCPSGHTGASNPYSGVILDFGILGDVTNIYAIVDLAGTGLFFQMPLDGAGAYSISLGHLDPSGRLIYDETPGTQPMLWGAGSDESPPDGRVGTQTRYEWDDSVMPDGLYQTDECMDLLLSDVCPDPLGAIILFMTSEPPPHCYADCDSSTAMPFLNINDFICFQRRFAAGDAYANCDGSTQAPILNVDDFLCFQARFIAGCSAP
jgi:hypothetical protein